MHHIFISLSMGEKSANGMAVIRTDEKGRPLVTYAGEVTSDKNFDKLCDDVYRSMVAHWDESYVVIVEGTETLRYFKKNKITLFDAPWLDITQVAWPMVASGMIAGRSVEQIANHFGITNQAPDTATGNCTFLAETYWSMMRSMRIALLAEEGVRDYGGKIISNVRALIGI